VEGFARLLLLVGLVGLHVRVSARPGVIEKIGFWVALVGLVLVVTGEGAHERVGFVGHDPSW
jgi:hypothetical protein